MLTSCAWCNTPFPPNDAIEEMPVGQRLAFDEGKGRLWAVCRGCERWNLAPIEQRWEAIEACARAFRNTRLRASTGQVGLARLGDGTELVRIGAPIAHEFAAWRYGDQFGRRRRKAMVLGAVGVAGAGAAAMGAYAIGASAIILIPLLNWTIVLGSLGMSQGLLDDIVPQRAVPDPAGGHVIPIGFPKLVAAAESEGGWGLEVPYRERFDERGRSSDGPSFDVSWRRRLSGPRGYALGSIRVTGIPARQLLARRVHKLNRAGAPIRRIRAAVDLIAECGGADALPRYLARNRARLAAQQTSGDSGSLPSLPAEVRLALEMAAHEDQERALLAGELAALEAQWRAADEEAAISDALLLPERVQAQLEVLRRAVRPGEGG